MSTTAPLTSNVSPGMSHLPPNIVVLVHGNNGSPTDFDSVEMALLAKYGPKQLLVIKSSANHQQTSHGVEIGGARLAEEIVDRIFAFELSPDVESYKFSIIGHSLGGLYARYAIATVMESLNMLNMEYVSFVTICTPHLGSRRARGTSTIKNIFRLGVHKILGSRTIYGQTGIDLLVDAQAGANVTDSIDPPPRPLLEEMSHPESEFIRSLKQFRFGTLVAMTDGDVVVPFPSASIRNFNPYPSTALTGRYSDWRWHIRYSGFTSCTPAFLLKLESKVDTSIEIDYTHPREEVVIDDTNGEDSEQCEIRPRRFSSVEGYDCDNKQEVEFSYEMLQNLQQQALDWRRIDVSVEPNGVKGRMRLHDWPINKMQPPGCRADEFIDLLCDMIGSDHHMHQIVPLDLSEKTPASPSSVTESIASSVQTEENVQESGGHNHLEKNETLQSEAVVSVQ